MKEAKRLEARKIRFEEGLSVKSIARKLAVSASSVSCWVKDIVLTDEQQIRLLERSNKVKMSATRGMIEKYKEIRKIAQEEGRQKAKAKDWLHSVGCMLFWAEGSKNRNSIKFVNTDVEMMKLFTRFLRESLHVKNEEIRARCTCYTNNGIDVKEIEKFWQKELALTSNNFTKSTVNLVPKSSKQFRKTRHKYGTCSISVHNTRLTQEVFGSIQEYAGIDRAEWLDIQ